MKLFLFFLFLAPFVLSYAGENSTIYTINDCTDLKINTTADLIIDNGEYSILNCVENQTNYWKCSCSGDYNVVLSTKPNTINNYTFLLNYNYAYYTQITYSSGNSVESGSVCPPGTHIYNRRCVCNNNGTYRQGKCLTTVINNSISKPIKIDSVGAVNETIVLPMPNTAEIVIEDTPINDTVETTIQPNLTSKWIFKYIPIGLSVIIIIFLIIKRVMIFKKKVEK